MVDHKICRGAALTIAAGIAALVLVSAVMAFAEQEKDSDRLILDTEGLDLNEWNYSIPAASGENGRPITRSSSGYRLPAEEIGVIIQFSDEPLLTYAAGLKTGLKDMRNDAGIKAHKDLILNKNSGIKKQIIQKNIKLKIKGEFHEVFNGIAAGILKDDITQLREIPGIKAIYADHEVSVLLSDSVRIINASKVWQMQDAGGRNITGKNVKVAIIDTGIDYNHPDLGGGFGPGYKVIGGWDVYNNDADPMDDHGHGTHVAGIVAANGSLRGVAPDALLMAYKVIGSGGTGSDSQVIAGIEKALDPDGDPLTDDGADILSLSLGGAGDPDDPLSQAVDNAVSSGAVVVVAAGNSGPNSRTINSPGTARKAITVGASWKEDTMAGFSSRGPVVWKGGALVKPDVSAPGVSIYSTNRGGGYTYKSGTSMATPMVSGTAALLKQEHPDWSPLEIKLALRGTSKDIYYDINTQGYGRIDALKAALLESAPPIAMLNTSGISGGIIDVKGTAAGQGFTDFSLEYSNGIGAWLFIGNSSQSVNDSILFHGWDTSEIGDGEYFLRLIVNGSSGTSEDRTMITVSNIELNYPLNNDIFRQGDILEINGAILGSMISYTLEYGEGYQPQTWLSLGMNLSHPGSANSSLSGTLALWNTSYLTEGFYTLRLTVNRNGFNSTGYVRNIYFDPSLKKGWPVRIGWDPYECSPNSKEICYYGGGFMEPTINDIDNDGQSEIIVYKSGDPPKIYVFKPDGSPKTGWPVNVGSKLVYYSMSIPVIADINNDGLNEIIAFNHNSNYADSSELYAFRPDGSYVYGWPVLVPRDYQPNIIAADLNNDGQKEIVVKGNVNYSSTRYLTIVGADGRIISNWQLNDINEGSSITSTPAIGNFDNDTDFEIVVGVSNPTYDWNTGKWNYSGVLHVFNLDGSEVPGWPVYTDGLPYSSPAVGDINNDGYPEIVIGLLNGNGGAYAFYRNGTVMPGWPFMRGSNFWSSPSLVDLNGDGFLEIAVSRLGSMPYPCSDCNTYLMYHNATLLLGWPRSTVWNDYYSTVLGDVNSDGIPEVITAAGNGIPPYAGGVYAWDVSGTLLNGFPKVTEIDAQAPAALGDVDNDGRVDIVASSDLDMDLGTSMPKFRGTIYAWDVQGKYDPQKMPWAEFHHDTGRTGLYGSLDLGARDTIVIVDDGLEDDPANHTWNTIQEGIDDATEGDIIFVRNGTYKENIAIYKPLTLIGEDNNNTIINGENKGDVVHIKANNVQIRGFKIINGRSEYSTNKVEIRGEVANGSFVWTPVNFGGFWYDIDNDAGNETLTAVVSDRNINKDDLLYTTTLKDIGFKYLPFGKYEAIGFMSEKYFSGYIANPTGNGITTENISTMEHGQLHKVLMDDDTQRTIFMGSTLMLNDGYAIKIKDVNMGAGTPSVWLTMLKDGNEVFEEFKETGEVFVYEKDAGAVNNLPLIALRINNISRGGTDSAVYIKGIFQISEYYANISTGNQYGIMQISSVSSQGIEMKNSYSAYLSKDSTMGIGWDLKFRIANSDPLRYYPFVEKFRPGTYEVRGSVATGSSSWNNGSFAGFFYDIDNNLGTETLNVTTSGWDYRTIGENDLIYSTSGQEKMLKVVEAKYNCCGADPAAAGLEEFGAGDMATHAGNYTIIGWMGEKYIAIRGKPNKLSKLLVEHGSAATDKKTLTLNETWNIGDGFTLTATSINAKSSPRQVLVTIRKDGVKKDEKLLTSGTTNSTPIYTYVERSLGGETDVPIFVTYVDSVFAGATTDMVQFRYTWFISEDVIEIKSGDEFGKLKVVSSTQENLVLKNNYPLSLDRGSMVNLFGDIKFKVADSPELRYYPASIKTIKSFDGASESASGVKLDNSENNILSDVNILNSMIGVYMYSAINNQFANNNISGDHTSVYLLNSFHNLLINNTLLSGGNGIKPEGYDRIHFNNSIDTSNELNGKPVYYYFNGTNMTLDGIDTNHLTIAYSTGLKIRNSTVGGDGINLYYSESNMISNNTFTSDGSNLNVYKDFSDKPDGQYVEGPSVQATVPPPVSGGGSGGGGGGMDTKINLYQSSYNSIASNTLRRILLDHSHGNIVTDNSASITLYNSNNNDIDHNNANNYSMGISLLSSSNNSLARNNVLNNLDKGIFLDSSYNNILKENSVKNNNWNGISLSSSSNNSLVNNSVSNNNYNAIELQTSNNNTLTGNIMTGSTYNLVVAGDGVSSYIQKIDTSNIVDGKPVFYLVNQKDQMIDLTSNAGYVGIINSSNITVRDLTLKNNSAGILFINVNNSKIENVTLSNNSGGIYLYYSNNNSINSSRASYNYGGFVSRASNYNTFSNNTIVKNERGISLDSSSNNTIKENYLLNNSEGILINYGCYWCWDGEELSYNNFIYHNNFINNTQNAIDYSFGDRNLWNAAYPAGGNYWSDYTGIDLKSGEFQDLPGSDGIGDMPYYRGSAAQDRYPFMNISGWLTTDISQPIADCGPDKLRCENAGSPVGFNGSASYDPDGSITAYLWEFGDGMNGTGAAPKHIYNTYRWKGTAYLPFIVNLTVIDNDGFANSTSQKIVIWMMGDANGDGRVNILDVALVGLRWEGNDPCADMNNDGKVNILDAAIMGLNWGKSA